MNIISKLILPLIVLIIIIYGTKKKINVYDTFITGAKESFDITIKLFPNLLAMILGINIFVKSKVLESILGTINPILELIKIPKELIPLAILRPISGSSGIALLSTIIEQYGTDNIISKMASVMQGSTDTTLYILTLYFGSVGIKKTKYALKVGLLADLIGIISAIIISRLMFN